MGGATTLQIARSKVRKRILETILGKLIAPRNSISRAARKALFADSFEKRKNYCQRWIRQVIQSVYGDKFNEFFKGTAKETGEAFLNSEYALAKGADAQVGDLYYWLHGHGDAGHVAILIEGNLLAQNSSFNFDGVDARIVRKLSEMDAPDIRVRLR